MPRAWELLVEPHPTIDTGRDYLMLVLSIKKNKGSQGIAVVVEHLDGDQAGRKHSIVLPLPIRPSGITAEFFKACYMEPIVGRALLPKEVIGRTIKARFMREEEDGTYNVRAFSPGKEQETRNVQRASKLEQHAASAADAADTP